MKALVIIPLDLYRILETKCGDNGSQHRLLKSGLIDRREGLVVIRCETDHALKLCAWANGYSRAAANQIIIVPDK